MPGPWLHHKPHTADLLVKGLVDRFAAPDKCLNWVLAGMVELRDSNCRCDATHSGEGINRQPVPCRQTACTVSPPFAGDTAHSWNYTPTITSIARSLV